MDYDSDGVVSPGDELQYLITISNDGLAEATGVILTDYIPLFTKFVKGSIETSQGSIQEVDDLTVEIGTIISGGEVAISLHVLIDSIVPSGTILSNQAVVTADGDIHVVSDDPDTDSRPDLTRTPIISSPLLDIHGTAAPDPMGLGGIVTYQFTYHNTGNAIASNVVVTADLPVGTRYSNSTGGSLLNDNVIQWELESVEVGEKGLVELVVITNSDLIIFQKVMT